VANGYSATGYGLAIRNEKDKSSVGYEIVTLRICKCGVSVCLEIISSIYLCCEKRMRGNSREIWKNQGRRRIDN
jgi:hypothetical protein